MMDQGISKQIGTEGEAATTCQIRWLLITFLTMIAIGQFQNRVIAQEWIRTPRPVNWRDDAELTDVHFVNADLGFAVGAQGTILRTENGGQDWKVYSHVAATIGFSELSLAEKLRKANNRKYQDFSKELDVFCRFQSVCFTDENNGWVAGGYEVPMTGRSQGVLFRTKDGGKSWREVRGIFVPSFVKLQLKKALPTGFGAASIATGWALAKTNSLFPGSVLETANSGTSWTTTPNRAPIELKDAVEIPGGMVVVSDSGELGVAVGNRYTAAQVFGRSKGRFNAIRMFNGNGGLAVGDRGALVMTTTGGETWVELMSSAKLTEKAKRFAAESLSNVDFQAIDSQGDWVWIVGNPGHTLLRFNRKTRVLETLEIPFRGVINQLQFVDDRRGWAVGSLGTVLATRDGGKTWVRQRGGAERVALLVVAEDISQLPLETLARYGAEEGYLTAVISGVSPGDDNEDAVYCALERLGNSQLELVASQELDATRIARAISAYRPTVVLAEGQVPFVERVAAGLRLAGSSSTAPWVPDRLAVENLGGSVVMSTEQVLPLTGRTVGDHIAISRALLVSETDTASRNAILGASEKRYELQGLTSQGKIPASLLFDGLKNTSESARRTSTAQHGNLDLIRLISQKRQTIRHLARWKTSAGRRLGQWRSEVGAVVNSLPAETAGLWLLELAETYRSESKPGLAADTLQFLVSRFPDHALSRKAESWLVHFKSSIELASVTKEDYRIAMVEQASAKLGLTTPKTIMKDGRKKTIWVEQSREERLAAVDELRDQEVSLDAWAKIRRQEASLILERSRASDPVISVQPDSKFTEAKISEYLQPDFPNDNLYQQLVKKNVSERDIFAFAAERELGVSRFLRRAGRGVSDTASQDRPVLLPILSIDSRPHLDGKLDEPFWGGAEGVAVVKRHVAGSRLLVDGESSRDSFDEVRIRHDGEFLYVALRIRKLKGQLYESTSAPRPRDPDLRQQDRIEICVDVDRDYRSAFRFVIDHRGWVADDCCGFRGWDPRWYVASSSDDGTWSAEVAIPLAELAQTPKIGDVWAIQCQRFDYASRSVWSVDEAQQGVAVEKVAVSEPGILRSLRFSPRDYQLFEFK